ncbi:hypothetical protein MTO96_006117 [Rhipicephalus appendiculatus]
MSSFPWPEITDPVVQSVISAQRRAPGVHIYLDAAYQDSTDTWTYTNVIDNFEKMTSSTMTYSILVQVHKDNPDYGIGLVVPDDYTVAIKMGSSAARYYPYGTEAGETTQGNRRLSDQRNHPDHPEWDDDPDRTTYTDPRALARGQRIMIGYYQSKKNFHVFTEYTTPGVEIVFQVTVTNFAVSIATKDKRVVLKDDLIDDGWYTLLVQNISITNMEIHTGPKPHDFICQPTVPKPKT